MKELWVQANRITSLKGIEMIPNLEELCLAGNPISDFGELQRLSSHNFPHLTSLSLTDVHFGRCPVSDDHNYKDYILNNLSNIRVLDDILITKEKVTVAKTNYDKEMEEFHAGLNEINNNYYHEISLIDEVYSNKESHATALEKEMSVALSELQSLVSDGRKSIAKYVFFH